MGWTAAQAGDQSGRVFIVTGANSGLGFQTVRALAAKGATVILGCRSADRAREAMEAVLAETPAAKLDFFPLDLASLASVEAFAGQVLEKYDRIDVLINNAGVMALPLRRTAEGFEMQLGTNHFGHFALTARLLARLEATPGSRVVTVSSVMHKLGKMRWDDLNSEKSYEKWQAYGQSKLANLLFSYGLARRLKSAGKGVISVAAHPGYSATELQTAGPKMEGSSWMESFSLAGNKIFAQTAEMGALPQLFAALSPEVQSGDYIGPDGLMEVWGHPRKVGSTTRSRSEVDQDRLWTESERLTGLSFGL